MKYKELISLEVLQTAQIVIFNTEMNWHFIHKRKVYLVNRNLDDAVYAFVKGNVSWEFLARRLRFYYINEPNVKPLPYKEFEIDEDIVEIFIDGERYEETKL